MDIGLVGIGMGIGLILWSVYKILNWLVPKSINAIDMLAIISVIIIATIIGVNFGTITPYECALTIIFCIFTFIINSILNFIKYRRTYENI